MTIEGPRETGFFYLFKSAECIIPDLVMSSNVRQSNKAFIL